MWNDENLAKILKEGGVAVMPTDTIYGIVGSAFDISAVNRIYALRKRNPEKPCIILVGNADELEKFSVILAPGQKNIIENFSVPTSFVLDCPQDEFSYLHRSTRTLAFRIPANPDLRNLLLKTGPLIAPSANPEGSSPAKNIKEAKNYFGNAVDVYVNGGEIAGQASKVIKLHKDGTVNILRE
jgi:L-threonylcarbamoyladenylate synthase